MDPATPQKKHDYAITPLVSIGPNEANADNSAAWDFAIVPDHGGEYVYVVQEYEVPRDVFMAALAMRRAVALDRITEIADHIDIKQLGEWLGRITGNGEE